MGAWGWEHGDGSMGTGAWGWEHGDGSMGKGVGGWEHGEERVALFLGTSVLIGGMEAGAWGWEQIFPMIYFQNMFFYYLIQTIELFTLVSKRGPGK